MNDGDRTEDPSVREGREADREQIQEVESDTARARHSDAADNGEREVTASHSLTTDEVERVRERIPLRAPAIFAIVQEEGEAELARPLASLIWSGIIAGLAMGFSVLTLGLLKKALPETPWGEMLASFGYSAGFVIVILGRLQLFTESTITAVLPLATHPTWECALKLLRLWSVVLVANLVGCFAIAFAFLDLGLAPEKAREAMLLVSEHLLEFEALEAFRLGIPAGFLVAALVWMLSSAEGSEALVIILVTWLISFGGFTHIIAGSVETSMLLLDGQIGVAHALFILTLPILAGNIIGGTALFALISYAQVKPELEEEVPEDI